MSNISTPRGGVFTGWFSDNSTTGTPVLKYYNRGTLVMTLASAGITAAGALTTDGVATLASAITTGNHTLSNTVTCTADAGTDGQELASGGAGVACTWEAA